MSTWPLEGNPRDTSDDYGDRVSGRPELLTVTLSQFQHGSRDRTCELVGGAFRRATWTPEGPGVLDVREALSERPEAWGYGPGGEWLVAMWARYRGDGDHIPDFEIHHETVAAARRRYGHLALGASGTPYHELLPSVLGQRITAQEAYAQWYRLVDRYGEPAPDPTGSLRLPPRPEVLAEVPYYALHRLGIEKKRADALREVGRAGHWLCKDWLGSPPSSPLHRGQDGVTVDQTTLNEATSALQRVRGVGIWTAAVAGGLAFGDPDALQVGDYHVKNTVAWALEGRERGTDDEMIASLEMYRGQRHRVVRWLEMDGWRAPMRGPKRRILSIARL